MSTKIFVHGSGHKATSWGKTISYITNSKDDAELKIIENTDHVVNEENPKALANIESGG